MPTPKLSIIIPARNEERTLPHCVQSVIDSVRQTPCSYEIIVVINRCTDRTEEVARGLNCRVVECGGKNLAMIRNAGAKEALGEILITIDADSRVSVNMIREVVRTLDSGRYVGGGVLIAPERYSLGILATGFVLLIIALYHRISGGLFFCTREAFWAIGGFDERLVSVEDIDFAKRLRRYGATKGRKFKTILRAHIITSCRKFDRFGDWYFILHPVEFLRLLGGKNRALSDKVWYDFGD